MSAIQAIVLGIVQGLTEFLPVSSTAHLRIVSSFFGWDDPGAAFTAVIQLGTMAAVLLYFREDLLRVARNFLAGSRPTSWGARPTPPRAAITANGWAGSSSLAPPPFPSSGSTSKAASETAP